MVTGLTADEEAIWTYLWRRYAIAQGRNAIRRGYYNAKNALKSLGIAIPTELEGLNVVLGWPRIAVEALADRCVLTGWASPDGDTQGMDEIADTNDLLVGAEMAHLGATAYGCHLAAVTRRDDGTVNVSLRPATHATAVWDHSRHAVGAALSIIDVDAYHRPVGANMYLPGQTIQCVEDGRGWQVVGRAFTAYQGVPVVPLRHAPDDEHPFGRSRITPSVMALTDAAMRTWARSEIAAEFFSSPQRYLLNATRDVFTDDTGELKSQWESIIGRIWAVPPPDDPEAKIEVGQFQAASQQPHLEQLRQLSAMLAAEVSIPPELLGFKQDNPSSEGALGILERPLVVAAQKATRTFGAGWRRVAQLALMVRDDLSEPSEAARRLQPTWLDPALPSLSQASAAVQQQVTAGILPADSDVTLERLGYDQPTIQRIQQHRRQAGPSDVARLTEALTRSATGAEDDPAATPQLGGRS